MPLRDSSGAVSYFLGGQVNVTSFLSSDKGLSFLVGGSHQDLESLPPSNAAAQSPALSAYLSTMQASSLNAKAYPLHHPKIRKAAGEAHDSAYSSSRLPFAPPESKNGGPVAPPAKQQEGTIGRIAHVLGFKERKSAAKRFEDGELYGKQKIVGAEGTLDRKGGGVETQSKSSRVSVTWFTVSLMADERFLNLRAVEAFQHTYTRALIFRKDAKQSIIFVSEPLLKFIGLPHKTPLELYSSKLLHKVSSLARSGVDLIQSCRLTRLRRACLRSSKGPSASRPRRSSGRSSSRSTPTGPTRRRAGSRAALRRT